MAKYTVKFEVEARETPWAIDVVREIFRTTLVERFDIWLQHERNGDGDTKTFIDTYEVNVR